MPKCAWCGVQVPEEDLPEHLDDHVEDMRDKAEPTDEQVVDVEEDYGRYQDE